MMNRIMNIFWIPAVVFLFASVVSASSVTDYKNTWEYRALQYQGGIDTYVPFGKACFLTTHNTYNAGVYSQNGSYIDPNQQLSIYDQLEVGIRAIELDVHYTFSSSGFWPWEWKFSEELKLSHAKGDTGTHPNDRFFTQGLSEIRNWLNNSPNEVLIIYLEDYIEGKYDKAISEMNSTIGDLVYKPGGCQALPVDLTKAEILASGKQIVLIGGNCATENWANYVYNGHFTATESLENFTAYDICTAGSRTTDYIQNNLVRIFEDSTRLAALFGDPGPPITADAAAEMTECGIGAIGMDQVVAYDARLLAQIWSWGSGEPNDAGGEDCAVQRSDGKFNDLPCDSYYPVACQNTTTGQWEITENSYTWQEASLLACETEFPGQGLTFSVPVNGYQNAVLRDMKSETGIANVWLNYSDRHSEGVWTANTHTNLALGKPTSQSSTYNGTAYASRAVDGNPNSRWDGGSVTHTNNDTHAFWQVDLETISPINEVQIVNRTDCCSDRLSNFYLFISENPMNQMSYQELLASPSVTAYFQTDMPEAVLTIPVAAQGRYVMIMLEGTNPLSLAEVLVF